MSLVAVGLSKVLIVKLLNRRVFVRLAEIACLIVVVKNCCSYSAKVDSLSYNCGLNGLTAAVYASTGTSHDLDELNVKLACLNSVKHLLSVFSTRSNCNVEVDIAKLVGSELNALYTTNLVEVKRLKRLALDNLCCGTESCLHNAAGCSKDSACARTDLKRNVKFSTLKCSEVDTCLADHSANLTGGNSNVNVRNACSRLTGSANLKLLSSTRNCGYEEYVLRIPTHLLCVVGLNYCAEHLLRRLTGGEVVHKLRIVVLAELDPSGRAGCDHRKCAAVLDSAKELGCFFHDGKVSGEIHIVNAVEAELLESLNHLGLAVSTGLVAEALTDLCSYGRSCADKYVLGRICESFSYLIGIVSLVECANGTSNDTLSAVYARGLGERHLECGSDVCIKSTVVSTDNADTLNYLTSCYAAAAKDTLVVIADDGGSVVDLILVLNATKACLVNAVLVAELLELAGCAAYAGETLAVVVGKKQLKVGLSRLIDLRCICEDLHSLGYGVYTSSYHSERLTALRNLNETETASADLVDILKVTKCR